MSRDGAYGELGYLDLGKGGRWWGMRAVPHVMIRAKRLFPRGEADRGGLLRLADSADVARDLEWFVDRYPLEMSDWTARTLLDRSRAYTDRVEAIDDILAGRVPRDLPHEPDRPARDYQLTAAALARTSRRMVLADDLGLGKTMSGLLLLADPDALPALVVCPTHLPGQWLRELALTWPELIGHAVTKASPYDLAAIRGLAGHTPDVLVMGYSKIAGWGHALAGQVRTVIFDEAQELRRGVETRKGTAAAHVARNATYVLGLTATPVYNYGSEVHNLYEIVAPDALGSRSEFLREWGGTATTSGQSTVADPAALGTYLRDSGLLLRRTRADVKRELPEPLRIRQEIDADTAALDEVRGDVEAMARLILDPDTDRRAAFTASGDLDWKLRQATGIAKAPYVAEFVRMLLASERKVVLFGWHRACFAAGTPALMYDGTTRKIEDVREGEQVMGPDSTPRTVRSLVRGTGPMYRIVPNKGASWVCSEHHVLSVIDDRGHYEKWTAGEFAARPEQWRRRRKLYRAEAVTFPHAAPVLEPWLVGYWIGDGAASLRDLRVISDDDEIDGEIATIADRHGLKVSTWASPGASGTATARHLAFSSGLRGPKSRNRLVRHFRDLGLDGRKRVPPSYALASIVDRRELLAGLIDADGYVHRGGAVGTAEYTSTDTGLAHDVAFVARSLGLAATIASHHRISGYNDREICQQIYRVTISGDLTVLPMRLARKRAGRRAGQKDVLRTGFRIEPAGEAAYYGFEVDGDHLFLLDDFTVVHNCYDIWVDALAEYRPLLYTGTESPTQKAEHARQFIEEDCRVLIVSLRSGAGLDGLQRAASACVFGELDWSPGVHDQAIGRLARDGQDSTVAAYFLVSTEGADPVMDEVLELKTQQAEPIRDPDRPILAPVPDTGDRVRRLAASVLEPLS